MKGSKLQRKLRDVCIPAALLAITFGICGPIQLYLTNIQELWFSIKDIWWLCLLGGTALFLVCAGIGVLLPQKITRYYGAAVFGVALALYVQGNFIPTDYGVLDGGEIDWSAYRGTAVVNSLIWTICILVPLVLARKKVSVAKQVMRVGSLLVIAMQVLTVGITLATTNFGSTVSSGYISQKGLNEVSSNKNVIVFILDSFDQEFFEEIYTNEPEYLQPLDGFTYFANVTGMYSTTKGSLPYIMTGKIYNNEKPHKEYVKETFESVDIYRKIKADNFDIGLYTDSRYVYDDAEEPVLSNYEHNSLKVSSVGGFSKTLYKFVAFRYFPHVLKQYVWFYSGEFDQWKQADASSGSKAQPYSMDNLDYYDYLLQNGLQAQTDKNIYHLIHIKGAHLPYELNEDVELVTDGSATYYSTSKAALKIVYDYIAQLRELDVYDNTMMVIMADHGKVCGEPTSPLLLVKRMHEQGEIKKNNAPVCQGDLIPTIMGELGMNEDGTYGRTLYDFVEGEDRVRKYYYYNLDWEEKGDYLPQMVEYEVDKYSNDLPSFHLVNYEVFEYQLGDTISFSDSATAHTYCITGFSIAENNYTWTSADNARMAFELNKTPQKNLLVHVNIDRVFNKTQEVIASVEDEVVYQDVLQGRQEIEFVIPCDLLEDNILEINFQFPDAISPAELKQSGDIRQLAVGFSQMYIEETDLQPQALKDLEGINPYKIGEEIHFDINMDGTKYFTAGISEPENGFAWSLGEASEMKLAVGEMSQQLTAEISVAGTIDTNQTIRISAQGVNLYDAPVPAGKSTIQFDIPASCIENGILTLEFSYPNAVAPNHIDTQSNDTRVLSVRYSSVKIATQSE